MIRMLQRRFALSRQGAVDLIKGCLACVATGHSPYVSRRASVFLCH